MEKPSELVKWFFLLLQTESAILMRIEFLVVVIALLYQLMSFLDIWRRRSRSSAIKYILLVLEAIADSTFLYTIGLMQNTPLKNDLFPVWALVLANLRFSGCFISAYGIPDVENRRISELSNVVALLGVAFLNTTRNSQFKHPIWALWALQLVRSIYLIFAYKTAFRSSLHGRSSAFVMASTPKILASDVVNLETMEGYTYPVYGDQKQTFKVEAPSYNFDTDLTNVATLDKIWQANGELSCADNDFKLIKDMCLSFSMYRLLRCRFDNFSLPSDIAKKTKLLLLELMEGPEGRKRTFRIVESELAFMNDYYYTRYPVVFFRGFPLPGTLHPVLTIAFTFWLGRDIHKLYRPPAGKIAHVVGGVSVDILITWVFMGVVVVKELWKMLAYLLSDWAKVVVLCEFVGKNLSWYPKWIRRPLSYLDKIWPACMERNLVRFVCTPRFKMVQRWHRTIGQYDFLQSYGYDPCNVLFYMSLGLLPKKTKGVKLGKEIKLPEGVVDSILDSIGSMNFSGDSLKGDDKHGLSSLTAFLDWYQSQPGTNQIDWAPLLDEIRQTLKYPTCAHTILVWHIATSMCEIDLAQHYNTSLTDSEVLRALKSAKSCFSSQPYMIKVQRLERALRANYTVANSVSRYCAYLLASEPEMLPDSYFIPELVLKSTIREASKILEGCDNLQSIYRRLMREAEEIQDNNAEDDDAPKRKFSDLPGISCSLSLMKKVFRWLLKCCGKKDTREGRQTSNGGDAGGSDRRNGYNVNRKDDTVINVDEGHSDHSDGRHQTKITIMGARLGRLLINVTKDNDVARWELLAGVWVDLLVHMAPSWNTDVHRRCLATGGEFITHIWAILCHCGVQKSNLWQLQEATKGSQDSAQQQAALSSESCRSRKELSSQMQTAGLPVPSQEDASLQNLGNVDDNPEAPTAQQFQLGSPLVNPDSVKNLAPEMMTLHKTYLEQCNKGQSFLSASFANDDFFHGDGTIQVDFKELFQLYQTKELDICILQLWCLRCKQQTCNTTKEKKVGFLDPSCVNKTTVEGNRHGTKGYVEHALLSQRDKDHILLPYVFNFHWILLVITPKLNRIDVMDSVRKQQSEFQDVIDMLAEVLPGNELTVHNLDCHKQPSGTNFCGYYVMKYMSDFVGENKTNVDAESKDISALTDDQLHDLQNKLCYFINTQAIDSKGRYHYNRGEPSV